MCVFRMCCDAAAGIREWNAIIVGYISNAQIQCQRCLLFMQLWFTGLCVDIPLKRQTTFSHQQKTTFCRHSSKSLVSFAQPSEYFLTIPFSRCSPPSTFSTPPLPHPSYPPPRPSASWQTIPSKSDDDSENSSREMNVPTFDDKFPGSRRNQFTKRNTNTMHVT